MKILVNGQPLDTDCATLAALLEQLQYRPEQVATAIDGIFIARTTRAQTPLTAGMAIDIVVPIQGG